MGDRKEALAFDFGGNPNHVTLGLGLGYGYVTTTTTTTTATDF